MHLPAPIQTYFEADRRHARDALIAAFAPDAAVMDEGERHVGRQAIGAWWSETKSRYKAVLEPLELREGEGAVRVLARVSGDFSGSPITLSFAFQLDDGRIKTLEIGQ